MSFASKERQREIASSGGKAAHAQGKAHKWTAGSAEASEAGRKGGMMHKARMEQRRRDREAAQREAQDKGSSAE